MNGGEELKERLKSSKRTEPGNLTKNKNFLPVSCHKRDKSQDNGGTEATGQPGVVRGPVSGAVQGGSGVVRGAAGGAAQGGKREALGVRARASISAQLKGGTSVTAAVIGGELSGPEHGSKQDHARTDMEQLILGIKNYC